MYGNCLIPLNPCIYQLTIYLSTHSILPLFEFLGDKFKICREGISKIKIYRFNKRYFTIGTPYRFMRKEQAKILKTRTIMPISCSDKRIQQSLYMFVCLCLKISPYAVPICFSFTIMVQVGF